MFLVELSEHHGIYWWEMYVPRRIVRPSCYILVRNVCSSQKCQNIMLYIGEKCVFLSEVSEHHVIYWWEMYVPSRIVRPSCYILVRNVCSSQKCQNIMPPIGEKCVFLAPWCLVGNVCSSQRHQIIAPSIS